MNENSEMLKALREGVKKMETSRDWSNYKDHEKRELAYLEGFTDAVSMLLADKKAELGLKN